MLMCTGYSMQYIGSTGLMTVYSKCLQVLDKKTKQTHTKKLVV